MQIIENIRFYNLSKLKKAQAIGGDDLQAVLAEYERQAGFYEVIEAEKPKKVAKKTTTRAKKTKK